MSRKTRIWTIIVLIIVILALIILYVGIKGLRGKTAKSALLALPYDAVAYFHGKDFLAEFDKMSSSAFWKSVSEVQSVKHLNRQIYLLDSLAGSKDEFRKSLNSNMQLISLHATAIDKLDVLAVLKTGKKIQVQDVIKLAGNDLSYDKRNYKGIDVYDYQDDKQESEFAFSLFDGLLVISKNPLLVEDAIRTYLENKGTQISELGYETRRFGNENWFIQVDRLASLLNIFTPIELHERVSKVNGFAGNGHFSFDITDDLIAFRGTISLNDSIYNYVELLQGQEAKKLDLTKVLSNKSALMYAVNNSNFQQWYDHFHERNLEQDNAEQYRQEIRQFETTHGVSIMKDIVPLLFGPFAISFNEPFSGELENSKIVLFKVYETDKSIRIFNDPGKDFSYLDTAVSDLVNVYRDYKIYKTELAGVFKLIFGNYFKMPREAYFVNIRDYLMFSSNQFAIQKLIDDYIAQQTLSTSSGFYKFSENLSSQTNLLLYLNPSRGFKIPEYYLNKKHLEAYREHIDAYKKIGAFAIQVVSGEEDFYTEMVASYSPRVKKAQEVLWEVALDTSYSTKPLVVKNHNDGSYEILLFDDRGQMYLIDASGKILWKKDVGEPPVGRAYQIDLYDNQKLQYLFTTKSHLHLVDRLGRDVANYPLRLSAPATSGLGVYDMHKNNKHRYYVGCNNEYVFGYNEAGKPLDGWGPNKISGNLILPVKYFIKNNITHLLAASDKGIFYLWDYKGNNIIDPVELKTVFKNPFQIQFEDDHDKTHLISVDTSGKTYFVYLSGDVELKEYGNWSDKVVFEYFDINGDQEKELVYAEGNTILGYSHKGQIVSSTSLETPIGTQVQFIELEGEQYVAYLNESYKQIYLVDLDGTVQSNFPMKCTLPFSFFDLDEDGNTEVIGGYGTRLFMSRF